MSVAYACLEFTEVRLTDVFAVDVLLKLCHFRI